MRYNHFDMLPIDAFRSVGGRMTLEGGGGGGGGDGGAGQREAERQARVRAATDQINRIFNGEVQKTGTRYVKTTQSGMPGKGGGGTQNQYISEAEYKNLVAQRDAQAAQAKQSTNRGVNGKGGMSEVISGEGGFSDPTAGWQQETYTYWDRDPNAQRQKLYDDQRTAIYDLNSREVERQAGEAERNNRFGLARNGLIGGSADIDSNAELNRRTNEGLLQAGGIADQAAADLKTQDERTRSSLLSMAQQGIDTGSAATMALNGLQANADNAAAQRGGATIGGLFNDLSQAYLVNKMMQGQNGALAGYNPNQFFGSASPTGNGAGSSGNVQKST